MQWLYVMECTRQPPTAEIYVVLNGHSAKVEKLDSRGWWNNEIGELWVPGEPCRAELSNCPGLLSHVYICPVQYGNH